MDACAQDPPEERQRALNDHLALIRILDDVPPFGEFGAFASEPVLGSGRHRRQTLLNFVAFCLARDDNAVALATTVCRRRRDCNQLTLHVARSTGVTTSYERERAGELLGDLKRAWRAQTFENMQGVLAHVVQMTEGKLRKRLARLRDTVRELGGAQGFVWAVDAWGKQEVSPDVFRWMNTWHCESQTAALKDVFEQLSAAAAADDFDAADLVDTPGQFRLYHRYFFPIAILIGSQFVREVEFGQTSLPAHLVRLIKRLRRRCIKLRWYEIGVHLLCTYARDAVHRILGREAFDDFLCRTDDDSFCINWLHTPNAISDPMRRGYDSAQAALLGVLACISDGSDDGEPYACNITHKPSASAFWTPRCVPVYHPELQIIDHLHRCNMRPSPAYVGCSRLACRTCKFYVDQLDGSKWLLNTGGLETMDLKVKDDWLIPPTDTGVVCASIVREEAARLVLREDNMQRIAWEMRVAADLTASQKSDDGTP